MTTLALESFLAASDRTVLDWRFKGFGSLPAGSTVADVRRTGRGLHELGTPMMTVDGSALADNLAAMARWCADRGLLLAPHGKTTMAPLLWLAQLRAGCSAITVATPAQLRAARACGVADLVLANELVDPTDIAWLADELDRDPGCTVLCWVDDVADVQRIEAALAGRRPGRPIPVCVEVGAAAGRTGARGPAAVREVARAVIAADRVVLAGVSGYEGAVPGAGTDPAGLAAVDAYLATVADAHAALVDLYETPRVTVTAGGSVWFDRVAAVLGPLAGGRVDVVLRSGAYAVHDDLHYARTTPASRGDGPALRAAIHVWARVLSRPEPDLVLLDAGRRDLPFDLDLPVAWTPSGPGTRRSRCRSGPPGCCG